MPPNDWRNELESLSTKLEEHFGDMCDFEFTVQEGRLYLLNARKGRRSAQAAIRIATDLFLEEQITGKVLVSRILPTIVESVLRPKIDLNSDLRELGRGMGASSGAATGLVAFDVATVHRLRDKQFSPIFVRLEFSPEDIHGIAEATGIVQLRGGMTSHAAVIARGMSKPCITGLGWSFDSLDTIRTAQGDILREEDPITIDGNAGVIFSGSARIHNINGFSDHRLLLVLRIIDRLAAENELPVTHIGSAWRVRDLILYGGSSVPEGDQHGQLRAWPQGYDRQRTYKAFDRLDGQKLAVLDQELRAFRTSTDDWDTFYIWCGIRTCLFRLLAKHVGVGRHVFFYRPLFDPCEAILSPDNSKYWNIEVDNRLQFVGEEFFSINHYVSEYIDIGSIRIYWAVSCESPQQLWRLDFTNPRGEKLLQGGSRLLALKVIVNDAVVSSRVLKDFYNYLRRKEYFWGWYGEHGISRREIIAYLAGDGIDATSQVGRAAVSAGLESAGGHITDLGLSLLEPSSAVERAKRPIKIGW